MKIWFCRKVSRLALSCLFFHFPTDINHRDKTIGYLAVNGINKDGTGYNPPGPERKLRLGWHHLHA